MIVSIIIFFFILGLLVLAHEFGHFLAAKKRGVRVEEFAFGFPPRLFGIRWGETLYSFNLIPVGGFVRLSGEAPEGEPTDDAAARRYGKSGRDLSGEPGAKREGEGAAEEGASATDDAAARSGAAEEGASATDDARSFRLRPLNDRVFIVIAGVLGNLLLAWALFSLSHAVGVPSVLDDTERSAGEIRVVITSIEPGSPAQEAGISPGDIVRYLGASDGELKEIATVESVRNFIYAHRGADLVIRVERSGEKRELRAIPRLTVAEGQGALGIGMVRTGIRAYPWYEAPRRGVITTWQSTGAILKGFGGLLVVLFTEGRLIADVAGPVGIAVLSHEAALLGFSYVLFFTAILSLNLAIINSLPLPALDGGRLLFLAVEWLKGSPVSYRAERISHTAGFMFLIALLVLVTYRDLLRLF